MIDKVYNIVKGKHFTVIATLVTVATATMLAINAYYSVKVNKERIKIIKESQNEA